MRLTARRRALLLEALSLAEQACQCDAAECARLAAKLGLKDELAALVTAKAKRANKLAVEIERFRTEVEDE